MGKKPRKNKMDPRKTNTGGAGGSGGGAPKKKEADWSFDDIVRSKLRRR